MGHNSSTPNVPQSDKTLCLKHPKFNNVKYLKDAQTDEMYLQTTVPVIIDKQYYAWVKRLKEIPSKSQTLMIPKNHQFEKQGLCGSSGIVKIDFENYPFLLSDQIINRQSLDHKQFQQNEIWYLLYSLILVAKDFHLQGRKVGDIRPQNIFINEDGQIKISSQYSFPGQQINYTKTFYERQTTYLSPQQIKDIQFGKIQSSNPFDLSESFSIGLTILDAALLCSSNDIYLKNGKFDYSKLDQKLKSFRNTGIYSQLLIITVFNLCQSENINRCTSYEIFQWLIPFQDSIYNLQEFYVTSLPNKFATTKAKMLQQPHNQLSNQSNIKQSLPIIKNNEQLINYFPGNNLPVSQSHYIQQIHPIYQQSVPIKQIVYPIQQTPSQYTNQNNSNNCIISQQTQGNYLVGTIIPQTIHGGYTVVGSPIPGPRLAGKPTLINQISPNQQNQGINSDNHKNYQKDNKEKNDVNANKIQNERNNQYTIALQRIDEQLKMSRKLFPS